MAQGGETGEVDLYRDTWVRYLGYANELGESFKAFLPRSAYIGSYIVSSTYVMADAYDKGQKEHQRHAGLPLAEQRLRTTLAVADTAIWQMFASVIIPGFAINRICASVAWSLSRAAPRLPINARKVATTAAGLSAIPFIIHPIDEAVEAAMEQTYRPWVNQWLNNARA